MRLSASAICLFPRLAPALHKQRASLVQQNQQPIPHLLPVHPSTMIELLSLHHDTRHTATSHQSNCCSIYQEVCIYASHTRILHGGGASLPHTNSRLPTQHSRDTDSKQMSQKAIMSRFKVPFLTPVRLNTTKNICNILRKISACSSADLNGLAHPSFGADVVGMWTRKFGWRLHRPTALSWDMSTFP